MTILERLGKADRRWWYLVLTIMIAWPIIRPLGLPTAIGALPKQFYQVLGDLEQGDTVVFSTSYIATAAADIHPGAKATMNVLMKKGVKVVFVAFAEQGDSYAEQLCVAAEAGGRKYGEDFVNLGFVAGGESGLAGFAGNPGGLLSQDYRGNPLSSLPIMSGISKMSDFRAGILATSGAPLSVAVWTRQVTEPHNVVSLMVYPGTGLTSVSPFLQSGQVKALLAGMPHAAQLEQLSGMPGSALAGMDAQTLGHIFFLVIIIMANLAQWSEKQKGRAAHSGGEVGVK